MYLLKFGNKLNIATFFNFAKKKDNVENVNSYSLKYWYSTGVFFIY